MKKYYLSLASIVLIFAVTSAVFSATDAGLPGEFLNFGVGARPMGMGKAFTSVADDVNAIYWNPAGLSWFRSNQVTFMQTPLLDGGGYQWAGYSQPIYGVGHVGIGVVNLMSGDIQRVDSSNPMATDAGTFSARETAYMLSYAYRFEERFGLGTTLKMAEQSIDDTTKRGYGLDLGAMYRFNEFVKLGANVRNLVQPSYKYDSGKDTFPRILRIGPSLNLFEEHLIVATDLEKTLGTSQNLRWHTGVEGWVFRSILLRAGVDSSEVTAGIGIKLKTFQFDYGMGFNDLDMSNRFSVTAAFGGYEVDILAKPRLFSPVGFKNTTTFTISATNRERITSWILEIKNSKGDIVKSFRGYTNPPRTLQWDGKDEKGRIVLEGRYTYRMTTTDKKKRTESTPYRSLRIKSPTPFEMEVK